MCPDTDRSCESVGIGASSTSQASPGIGTSGTSTDCLPYLAPEGAAFLTESVYDCIAYLIYCPEHDRIAVTNVDKCHCTWLPFVVLPSGVTWQSASHEGIETLIGNNDAEMDAEEAERTAPVYEMHILHILRLQLPSRETVMRLTQFVHLQANEFFQCCTNTERVNWLPVADVIAGRIDRPWAPEIDIMTTLLTAPQRQAITEFTTNNALYYLHLEKSVEQTLLRSLNLTSHHLLEIYTKFVEHCYPAFFMCFDSFRTFFLRHGQSHNFKRLFNAFCIARPRRSYIDFHEFLICLSAFEPNCSSKLAPRAQFVFRYYDTAGKGFLDTQDVLNLLKDASPTFSAAKLTMEAQQVMQERSKFGGLHFTDFCSAFIEQLDIGRLQSVCRSPISNLKHIPLLFDHKLQQNLQKRDEDGQCLFARRSTKGTCWACRAQQYQWGTHCVTIDTVGRCVEPSIIIKPSDAISSSISKSAGSNVTESKKVKSTKAQSESPIKHIENYRLHRERYSLEYVFLLGSVGNIFLDLVRNSYATSPNCGVMTSPKEWSTFLKYLRVLLRDLSGLLLEEPKLVKVNSPAIVIGDLQGNLADLLKFERQLFPSFPAIAEQLIFLGNYSGQRDRGLECMLFVFSLKLCSPNKVVLLRGSNELDGQTSSSLFRECCNKYGKTHGKTIYTLMWSIFAQLPIAVLVDDTFLCTHSGIPSTNTKLDRLLSLPNQIVSSERDAPIAYELIMRNPKVTLNVSSPNNCNQPTERLTDTQAKCYKIKQKDQKSIKTKKVAKSLLISKECKSIKSNRSIKRSPLSPSIKVEKLNKSNRIKAIASGIATGNLALPQGHKSKCLIPKIFPKLKFAPLNCQKKKNKRKIIKTKNRRRSVYGKDKWKAKQASPESKSNSCNKRNIAFNALRCTFDCNELGSFLEANQISFLLRSHTPCNQGFRIDHQQQCLTIFSCSNFDELQNQSAVALIDHSDCTLRFVRCGEQKVKSLANKCL